MNQAHIRNFAIIAHIDHGKSTLADRFLEVTKTISQDKMSAQFLDQSPISRERGITIKLAPVRMVYQLSDGVYTLNLIDTPGHVDFSYEVSRTMAACEGAILLVDATQGIQAQTIAHFQVAKKEKLVMIPVINKVDLPNAQVETVKKELVGLGFSAEEILLVSAKTGQHVEALLEAIVKRIPSPSGNPASPLRALIFDAVYDEFRGVIAYCRIVDGNVKKGEKIQFFQSKAKTEVTEVGMFAPSLKEKEELETGEIGYIIGGIKDIRKCRVGDTIVLQDQIQDSLPGYTTPLPMVFFGVYPKDQDDFPRLRESLGKLTLNDTALTYTEEYSAYLGSGYRIGFLGLLHAEIVKERLQQEFGLDLLLTMPQVLYETRENGEIFEPYMLLNVYTPAEYIGSIMSVCQKRKGALLDLVHFDTYAVLSYEMPYSTFIRGLSGEVKSVSAGFASVDYELSEYKKADLVKIDVLINSNPIDVLSELAYRDEAMRLAKEKAEKLKDTLPRQQFRQIVQATVDNVIVARDEISPFRKDVLQKMSGGDRTRKDKLLKKQKKGKSRMTAHAKVHLPQEALYSLMER